MVKVIDFLCSLLWSIIWLIILFFIVWLVGFIVVIFFVFVLLLNVCCDCIKSFMDFFMKGVNFLYNVVSYVVDGK